MAANSAVEMRFVVCGLSGQLSEMMSEAARRSCREEQYVAAYFASSDAGSWCRL
jgi:hypothetical protein